MEITPENRIVEMLAETTLETRFKDISPRTIEDAKTRLFDTIGCLISGILAQGNHELIQLIKDFGGKEEATILIDGSRVSTHDAALVNSIICRSYDFEPISPLVDEKVIPGHISGSTVMTALNTAEATSASGREAITALIVGEDIASRVLAASDFGFAIGWDGNGTANALGTTAIAGRLFGLSKAEMINAFGLVLSQMGGTMQNVWDRSLAFKLPQGLSARNGIFSARLAHVGWNGPDDPLFSKFGYFSLYTEGDINKEMLTKDLGKRFYSDSVFKPYPCCRKNHAAIDCALEFARNRTIEPDDIREIVLTLKTGSLNHVCGYPFRIGAYPQVDAAFSFQYTVATAILNKGIGLEHFQKESISSPVTDTLIKKIKMVESPEADIRGTMLKAIMKNGEESSHICKYPKGDPQNPMSKDELLTKFWNNVDFAGTVNRENAAAALDLIENLDTLDNVNGIIQVLRNN